MRISATGMTLGLMAGLAALTMTSLSRAAEPERESGVGVFLDVEWRALAIGGHLSHGPGVAAGISLWDRRLRLGLAGIGRPGPWNPTTFDVTVPNGETYRGKRVLSLRSDGGMAGLHVALAWPLTRYLSLTIPATLGYGGFGFYLHGDDRDTPDGRRVSEWENELFDGQDSHLGIVLDGGLRLHWHPAASPWLKPYVAGYYTSVPNYETVVRDDYSGVSVAFGIEVAYE